MSDSNPVPEAGTVPTCYRHPDVPTGIVCTRCGRPICGQCMIDAAVGFQCPTCVMEGMRSTRAFELPYGGTRVADTRRTTVVLIAVNVIIFLVAMAVKGFADQFSLTPAGTCLSVSDPDSYYPNATAAQCAASGDGNWVPGVAGGRWWQIVTSAFLHTQLWHVGLNMMALWILGQNLERVLGRARFLALYLVSALTGSAAVMWLASPDSSSLGASGAIFGMFAAFALLVWRVKGDFKQVLYVLGINAVISFMPGISWQAHLGGFLGGLVVAAIIVFAPRENRSVLQWAGVGVVTALTLGAIALRVLQLI